MLLLCVLPVGYAIVWVEPSWHCGPFSGYKKIYHLATKQLTDSLPEPIQRFRDSFDQRSHTNYKFATSECLILRCLDYIASPGIVIPLIVLMTLIIYYMVSLTGSLREANNDLKVTKRTINILIAKIIILLDLTDRVQGVSKKVLQAVPPDSNKDVSRHSRLIFRC